MKRMVVVSCGLTLAGLLMTALQDWQVDGDVFMLAPLGYLFLCAGLLLAVSCVAALLLDDGPPDAEGDAPP